MPGWTSPQLGGLPHLQSSHGENSPQLSGLPGPADRATRLCRVPILSCERDQEKKRDCLERLGTPPGWVHRLSGVPHLRDTTSHRDQFFLPHVIKVNFRLRITPLE